MYVRTLRTHAIEGSRVGDRNVCGTLALTFLGEGATDTGRPNLLCLVRVDGEFILFIRTKTNCGLYQQSQYDATL